MEINVKDHIAEVLYEKNKVEVPGIGGFETTYNKAKADIVSGKMVPPGKELRFSKNIPGNDGFLVRYIKDKHTLSYADAQQVVSEYASEIKTSLENKEIVVFPKIGRLYKDYQDELKFLPDQGNFNKSTFGLPPVQILPNIKTPMETVVPEVATAKKLPKVQIPVKELIWENKKVITRGVGALVGILFLFFTVNWGIDRFYGQPIEVSLKVNESPSRGPDELVEQPKELIPTDEFSFTDATPAPQDNITNVSPYEAIKENLPQPKEYVAVVSLGAFAIRINADRLASTLKKNGYENPKVTPLNGGKARVTLEISYDTPEELEQALSELERKINPDDLAVILKRKNGEDK